MNQHWSEILFDGPARFAVPLAERLPEYSLLSLSGGLWIGGFGLFAFEDAPILWGPKVGTRAG